MADVDLQYSRLSDDSLIWLLSLVIGTIGNSDLLANIKRHQKTKQTFLTNLVAANFLAIFCIPVHYFHQFSRGCGLGIAMRTAFWISRDLATGVQIFAVAVLSAVRFHNVWLGDNCVSLTPSASTKTSAVRNTGNVHQFCRDVPVLATWTLATCSALPAAVASHAFCYIRSDYVFEDTNTRHVAIFHCVAYRVAPLFCAACLHVLTELKRRNPPYSMKSMDDNGTLISWLIITVTVNYIPLLGSVLHSWAQHKLLTIATVDTAMYFPLYSTASCIPVVVYFTTASPRLGPIQTV